MIKYISNSKKGIQRDKNQDRVLIINADEFYFFAVFDGVSSYPNSYKFIELFKRKIYNRIIKSGARIDTLRNILYEGNLEAALSNIQGASTISAIYIHRISSVTKYLNIGDSRIYGFNHQFLEPITVDDSLGNGSNIITKCLGSLDLRIEDFKFNNLNNAFNYLLCTDGFHSLMEKDIKKYFLTLNFKRLKSIKRKISSFQRLKNMDDSSYIIIKNEIQS